MLGGLADFLVDLLFEARDALGVENAFAEQVHLHLGERVAQGVRVALALGAVEAVVVGKRVRIGADDVPVDKGWSFAATAVGDCVLKGAI